MSHRLRTTAAILLAGGLLTLPALSPAFAQTPEAATATSPTQPSAAKRDAFVEQHITQLRTTLKITPAEQPAFDSFANVMRQNAAKMSETLHKRRMAAPNATAVEQLQDYDDVAQLHAQNLQNLVAAFTTFYGTLTPEQKKLADQSFRRYSASGGAAAHS